MSAQEQDPQDAALTRFARMALECVHREYPNKVSLTLEDSSGLRTPQQRTPAFYGCFDWHSAVHGHWLLARVTRTRPALATGDAARTALARSFTRERLEVEAAHLKSHPGFELPYGLAWLLQLAAELHEWDDPDAGAWSSRLQPLAQLARRAFARWLPKLTHPIRTGEHSQTAFAMGLALDACRTLEDADTASLLANRAVELHGNDRDLALHLEPSGYDFLSPSLAVADLMRRVLEPDELAPWLHRALPGIPTSPDSGWLRPVASPDPADGKLAHLDGLTLSRAWMLDGIVSGLPPEDTRIPVLREVARQHRAAGVAAVTGDHYAGSHWLGTFAVYLLTGRGLPAG